MYVYAGNNPVRYIDPTGQWIENDDGSWTAEAKDTLWGKYGANWYEKSGFTRDPRTLQIGETVGKKNEQHNITSESDVQIHQENIHKQQNPIETLVSFYFSKWSYVPVEGIGILGGASFMGTITMSSESMSIFSNGFFVAQNLVDDYVFVGYATLFVDGNKIGKSYFQYPDYAFITNGPPFRTIGEATFKYDFSAASSVEIDLHFNTGIAVDSGINKQFINYSKERIKIK